MTRLVFAHGYAAFVVLGLTVTRLALHTWEVVKAWAAEAEVYITSFGSPSDTGTILDVLEVHVTSKHVGRHKRINELTAVPTLVIGSAVSKW